MPGPLVVFGNPGGDRSEREAWEDVLEATRSLRQFAGDAARVKEIAKNIGVLAEKMLRQVNRGIHRNPGGAKRTKIGEHVQAIVYIHAKDGKPYVHGFGNADIDLASRGQGNVTIRGLHDDTRVSMYGEPDGTVTIEGERGQKLWSMHTV